MRLKQVPFDLTICQLDRDCSFDLSKDFYCLMKTEDEISLVCKTQEVPVQTLHREDGWRAFYIDGCLDFSLVGILSKISALLADRQISIFSLSTYNTDYIISETRAFG